MMRGFYITGTDTGIGKTRVACALLHAYVARGRRVTGMKPIASGCEQTAQGLRNADALALAAHGSQPPAEYALINPYPLAQPIAPHIAAAHSGINIDINVISAAYDQLAAQYDCVVVEGVGGYHVPLNAHEEMNVLLHRLHLPLVLVVGLRLGCINHALLTAQAIQQDGFQFLGWVANAVDPDYAASDETVAFLTTRWQRAPLARLPYAPTQTIAETAKFILRLPN